MSICSLATSSVGFGNRIYSGLARRRCNKGVSCFVEVAATHNEERDEERRNFWKWALQLLPCNWMMGKVIGPFSFCWCDREHVAQN